LNEIFQWGVDSKLRKEPHIFTRKTSVQTVFAAAVTEPAACGGLGADLWALTKLATDGGRKLDAMRLVRWAALKALLDKRWAGQGRGVANALRAAIEARSGEGHHCVRYDDVSFLVIAPGPSDPLLRALDGDFIATLGKELVGVLGTPDLIEVWRPVAISPDGFAFERVGSAPERQRPLEGEVGAADKPEAPPAEPPTRRSPVILRDAAFHYYPLWDVRGNMVFCYLCEATWDMGSGHAVAEDDLADQFSDPKRLLPLDLETFSKATDELDRGLDHYRLASFLIPVHYRTLTEPATAEDYIRYCNRKVWSVREFAYFEIIKPPPDVSEDELAAAARQVQPFGAGVLLRAARGFDRFDRIPAGDILSVGLDLRTDRRSEREIIADLEALGAGATERGFRSHVHGLTAMSTTLAAACAGVNYIGGEAIGLDDWTPADPETRPIDLFKSLLAASDAKNRRKQEQAAREGKK
jgi:hypothetical protein